MSQSRGYIQREKYSLIAVLLLCFMMNASMRNIHSYCRFARDNSILVPALFTISAGISAALLWPIRSAELRKLHDQLACCCILSIFCLIMLWVRVTWELRQFILLLLFVTSGIALAMLVRCRIRNSEMRLAPAAMIVVAVSGATMRIDLSTVGASGKEYWLRYFLFGLPRLYFFMAPAISLFTDAFLAYRHRETKEVLHEAEKLTKAADSGDTDSQYNLAQIYLWGNDVIEADTQKAIRYLTMAAENGSAQAEADLGAIFYHGTLVKKDIPESLKWFRRAAEHGHSGAQYSLGTYYLKGERVAHNYAEAFRLFRLSAEQNFPEGQRALSICYRDGLGVEKDPKKAIEWLKKAADNNLPDAQFDLWNCLYNGHGTEKDKAKAYDYLLKAYNNGDCEACYTLGRYYFDGESVAQDDEKAFTLFREAAGKGSTHAMYYLGRCLHEGRGTKADHAEALKCLEAAAKKMPLSQVYLAFLYFDGDGIEQDYEKAFAWMKKAAESGHPDGAYYLAEFYEKGHGTEVNLTEAMNWYAVAEKRGAEGAHEAAMHIANLIKENN